MKIYTFKVEEQDLDRIDRLIAVKLKDFTRSQIQKLCDDDKVLVNSRSVAKSFVPEAGDIVQIQVPEEKKLKLNPEKMKLDILYQDEYLAVINKPKGMLVHPTPHQSSGTLVNALLFEFGDKLSEGSADYRPGIVHRLDKDTSGLLIIALQDEAHKLLARNIAENKVVRKYQAVVHGDVKKNFGTINRPIARDPNYRVRMAVVPGGREAITHYEVIHRYDNFTHLKLQLETGRTHQIRVHMASIGHPLAGDSLYAEQHRPIKKLNGQCLHAYELEFLHPITEQKILVKSDLPDYFKDFINQI